MDLGSCWSRSRSRVASGVLVHGVLLAPLAVVVGFIAIRRAPAPARRGARFAVLVLAAVVMVAIPLLATGGLRT